MSLLAARDGVEYTINNIVTEDEERNKTLRCNCE